jgi:hypothetical protein
MKKRLKASFRQRLRRVERRIERLPEADPFRPVLADYADAMRTTLLEGGVAPFALGGMRVFDDLTALAASLTPFALGGMRVFDDLTALAASLTRCQEKGGMCFCVV